jgi:hypothetical protein
MMLALEEDTPGYYETVPDKLDDVDPSAVLLSISIPIPGTPFHRQMEEEGRIFDHNLAHYEGDHLVFTPRRVSPDEVFEAFHNINRVFYSWPRILKRWWRFVSTYLRKAKRGNRFMRALLLSYIFFKLSLFQRHHAQEKVFAIPRTDIELRRKHERSADSRRQKLSVVGASGD